MNKNKESQGGDSENYSLDLSKIKKRLWWWAALTVFWWGGSWLAVWEKSPFNTLWSISLPTEDTLLAEKERVTDVLKNGIKV